MAEQAESAYLGPNPSPVALISKKHFMDEKLFVYGTLKDFDIQKKVIGRVVVGKSAIPEGYKRSKIKLDNKIFPIITPEQKSFIRGFVFSVTKEELERIDKYETDVYRRTEVKLKSGRVAWVYQK